MGTEKVSITLDSDLLAEAREVAGSRALSGYLNRALRQQLRHDRLNVLLAELEREHGPIAEEVIEEVRAAWPDPRRQGSVRRSG